ncbi:hypothetical protein AAY473_028087 [Plecturocebus cupreus]
MTFENQSFRIEKALREHETELPHFILAEKRDRVTVSPRLDCMILALCNLHFPCSKMGFCYIGQAGLKLLTSGDLSTLASQSAEITGRLTPFAGSSPVSSASTVADETVPAVLAHSIVLAGVAVTLLGAHP